jgi:DNA mismatch endonuclease (patch repair protein)
MMAAIRGTDTRPELVVRRYLHARGMRFRLHGRLPGRPDIVLAAHRSVVFVHGCFWHRHSGCRFTYVPKTRRKFWTAKFRENVSRDRRQRKTLSNMGWRVFVIWECEADSPERLRRLERGIAGGKKRGRGSIKAGK